GVALALRPVERAFPGRRGPSRSQGARRGRSAVPARRASRREGAHFGARASQPRPPDRGARLARVALLADRAGERLLPPPGAGRRRLEPGRSADATTPT